MHIPTEIVKKINNIIFEIILVGKTNKVSKHISIHNYNRGGIKMIDFGNIVVINLEHTIETQFLLKHIYSI